MATTHSRAMSFSNSYLKNFLTAQQNFRLWQIENYVKRSGLQEKLTQDDKEVIIKFDWASGEI